MGISLSEDEAWDFIAQSHTGILTTLRRDGTPISLPLWFAAFDRAVWFQTPNRSMKVRRVACDPRACFLVESGEAWRELKAVMAIGTTAIVEDDDARARAGEAISRKYATFRPDLGKAPEATRKHYGGGTATLRFTPERFVSWDNARIRFRG